MGHEVLCCDTDFCGIRQGGGKSEQLLLLHRIVRTLGDVEETLDFGICDEGSIELCCCPRRAMAKIAAFTSLRCLTWARRSVACHAVNAAASEAITTPAKAAYVAGVACLKVRVGDNEACLSRLRWLFVRVMVRACGS